MQTVTVKFAEFKQGLVALIVKTIGFEYKTSVHMLMAPVVVD